MSRISVVGWKKGLEILDQRLTEVEENGGGGGAPGVTSVNGQDGVVVLSAADVGALPDTYTQTGAQVNLTGYAIGVVANAAVDATDSVNDAIAKLEKRIADLEAG